MRTLWRWLIAPEPPSIDTEEFEHVLEIAESRYRRLWPNYLFSRDDERFLKMLRVSL